MPFRILILNGPNLNLLGRREPEIYGSQTFEQYFEELRTLHSNQKLEYFQSNAEGVLISKLQEVGFSYDGIIFNAGAYAHTSIALADAIAAIKTPVIEVHISNIYARASFRRHSYLAPNCLGSITGLGLNSYALAIRHFLVLNRKGG